MNQPYTRSANETPASGFLIAPGARVNLSLGLLFPVGGLK